MAQLGDRIQTYYQTQLLRTAIADWVPILQSPASHVDRQVDYTSREDHLVVVVQSVTSRLTYGLLMRALAVLKNVVSQRGAIDGRVDIMEGSVRKGQIDLLFT